MYINSLTWIISINDHICYIKNGGNDNSPDSLNVMVNLPFTKVKTGQLPGNSHLCCQWIPIGIAR